MSHIKNYIILRKVNNLFSSNAHEKHNFNDPKYAEFKYQNLCVPFGFREEDLIVFFCYS